MQPTTKINAVVFDLDGLMFNTEDVFNKAGHELVQRRGKIMTDDVLSQMMGRRADEAFAIMIELLELKDSIELLQREAKELFFGLLDDHLAPMPGLFELLDAIESLELPKAVATSSHRPYLEDILNRYELLDRFHLTLAAEDVDKGKPHPEIYLKAAERMGVPPTQMLVLEDSQAGTQAAAAANAVVISIPHEHSRSHDFSPATAIAASLHDAIVLDILNGGKET